MNFVLRTLALAGLLLTAAACGGRTGSAATLPDGGKVSVVVLFDGGITPEMDEARRTQMEQLGTWMKQDLVAILDKTGYTTVLVEDPAQATAGDGRYVLDVRVTNYNAGSKAARMFVGYGAGAATLDTHFELRDAQNAVLVSGDPSVGSSRDWTNAARKVNLLTVDPVNAELNTIHGS